MRLLPLALALFAAAASAQAPGPADEARRLLAAGDSAAAYDLVTAASRRAPDDADLRRLRLGLHLAGFGVRGVPRFARQQQIVDVATALRRLAPADTLALRVLVDDALWTVLGWHDRVQPGAVRSIYGDFVSPAEIRSRLAQSRFDMEARRAMAPDLDQSGRAREAHEEALALLDAWLAEDPRSARAHEAALTLAVVTENWAGALALARRYQAVSASPRADLYAALALYRSGDGAAAEATFDAALPRLDAAERARYEDVQALLPLDRREAYDADPEAEARAFWATADPRLLTEANERVAEHRARVVEADLLFGWTADDLFALARPRGAETEQGQIWVRYGRPSATVRFTLSDDSAPAYSTAADRFADSNFSVWAYDDFQFVFEDPERDGRYRTYSPPANAFGDPGTTMAARNDDFVMQDRAMQRTDPQRTQDLPERPLDVPALVSRFRAPGGGTDVVVAWGVPTDSVAAPVRTGAFLVTGGAVVQRAVEERRALAAGRVVGTPPVWAEAAQLTLVGEGTLRVEVEGDDGRAFGSAAEAVAPLAGGGGLAVSDLLLATAVDEDGRGPVVRRGIGIVPAPRAAFATGDPVYVYLEAYGLGLEAGRSRYTVEAALRPEARRGGLLGRIFGRGQGPGVSVRTEATGDRSTDAVTFFVDVRDQDPGRYTLTVTVADAVTGATASAERALVLE